MPKYRGSTTVGTRYAMIGGTLREIVASYRGTQQFFSSLEDGSLVIEDSTLDVAGGGTVNLRVKLGARPASNVTVAASEASNLISLSGAPRIFTQANWDTYQSVGVAATHLLIWLVGRSPPTIFTSRRTAARRGTRPASAHRRGKPFPSKASLLRPTATFGLLGASPDDIYKSTDGGATWDSTGIGAPPGQANPSGISVAPNGDIWLVGSFPRRYLQVDGRRRDVGLDRHRRTAGANRPSRGVSVAPNGDIWLVGSSSPTIFTSRRTAARRGTRPASAHRRGKPTPPASLLRPTATFGLLGAPPAIFTSRRTAARRGTRPASAHRRANNAMPVGVAVDPRDEAIVSFSASGPDEYERRDRQRDSDGDIMT